MRSPSAGIETLHWVGGVDGHLALIDQTKLPNELVQKQCMDVQSVWEAIQTLQVRGAPAIGIAAAYGVVLAAANAPGEQTAFNEQIRKASEHLATSRPTAVNLFWALDRMRRRADAADVPFSARSVQDQLLAEAHAIHDEDRLMCRQIGSHGVTLLQEVNGVLTHCNAGGLATSEYGTALSVFFTAQDQGKSLHVYVDETRPLLQGARLTAWELLQRGIPTTLICDSMAAQVMREGKIQAVVTGADRIAANGDAANKIGTYSIAVLARHHQIPFYVAAPSSTFDLTTQSGDHIPIELRQAEEITCGFGRRTAPEGVDVYNPAFDVTPADLITAIVTEKGIISPVNAERIQAVLAGRV